jgi:hypothetical protein
MLFNKYKNIFYKNTNLAKINFYENLSLKKKYIFFSFKYSKKIIHNLIILISFLFFYTPFYFFLFKGLLKKFLCINTTILLFLNKTSYNNIYFF